MANDGLKIKALVLSGLEDLFTQMKIDGTGQNITKFFAIVGVIHFGSASRLQRDQDGFHPVFLGIGHNPMNLVL